MIKNIKIIILSTFCFSIAVVAYSCTVDATKEIKSKNIKVVENFIRKVLVEKKVSNAPQYLSQDFMFYRDYKKPVDLKNLMYHMKIQSNLCATIKIPIKMIFASGTDKVTAMYSGTCLDDAGHIKIQTRMITIYKMAHFKISKMWQITHNKGSFTEWNKGY